MRSQASHPRLFACLIIAAVGCFCANFGGGLQPARAQDDVVADFHESLAPYGQWSPHPRWGEVWIPAYVPAKWAPYRDGHWTYSDEWGWYWLSDEDFGWITYHYGRWLLDPDLGWIWIPGSEWGPAWVSWRRGEDAVGWAPMPPDEVIDEYEDMPDVWCFVRPEEILTQRVGFVAFPHGQDSALEAQTVLVNRTVSAKQGDKHFVANPGIPPSFIAAKIGHPIQTVAVQPHVVRGTVGVAGAVVGEAAPNAAIRETIFPQTAQIQPAASVPAPVRFQPGHLSPGPDAPYALRRMLTSASGSGASSASLTPANRGLAAHPQPGASNSVQGNLPQQEFRPPLPLPAPQRLARPAPPPPPPPTPPPVVRPVPRATNGRDATINGL
jgi:hypothetical protein